VRRALEYFQGYCQKGRSRVQFRDSRIQDPEISEPRRRGETSTLVPKIAILESAHFCPPPLQAASANTIAIDDAGDCDDFTFAIYINDMCKRKRLREGTLFSSLGIKSTFLAYCARVQVRISTISDPGDDDSVLLSRIE
jgi:hypothetical protein